MRRMLAIGLLFGSALVADPSFAAPVSFPSCCACLGAEMMSEAQPPQPLVPARLCAEVVDSESSAEFESACADKADGLARILCVLPSGMYGQAAQDGDNLNCAAVLEMQGIQCAPASAAPLLGMPALVGLGLLLAGLGAWTVRRRYV